MGSSQSTADFMLDQLSQAGPVTARKMFGEYGLYFEGKMVAVVCDDQLFIKPTPGGRTYIGTPVEVQPFPQAKTWFLMDGEQLEDRAWLAQLVRITARELPQPAPKKPKKPSK
ncbi:TfoX/Sxy family protein [Pseudoduganella sp. GCM10020061]|uniref:TfoX/Sxy family protein n=1 Tax=Pseudoduganella sp. GCM10020061 TaxID=3317345 RepID=UPI00363CCB1C